MILQETKQILEIQRFLDEPSSWFVDNSIQSGKMKKRTKNIDFFKKKKKKMEVYIWLLQLIHYLFFYPYSINNQKDQIITIIQKITFRI